MFSELSSHSGSKEYESMAHLLFSFAGWTYEKWVDQQYTDPKRIVNSNFCFSIWEPKRIVELDFEKSTSANDNWFWTGNNDGMAQKYTDRHGFLAA